MVPITPAVTGITFVLTFHISCILLLLLENYFSFIRHRAFCQSGLWILFVNF